MLAELGQVAVDERPRRRGNDDLAAVARGGDPRRAVQLAAGVALAGQMRLSGVQAHPHLDRVRRRAPADPRAAAASASTRIGEGV